MLLIYVVACNIMPNCRLQVVSRKVSVGANGHSQVDLKNDPDLNRVAHPRDCAANPEVHAMIIGKRRDVHEKIKGLAIGTVALLAMTVCPDATQAGPRGIPRGGPPAAQNGSEPIPSDPSQPVDASSRTLGCGTATNIGLDNMAPLYVDGNPCNSSFVCLQSCVHQYQDMSAWVPNELSGHRPCHSRYRLGWITDRFFCDQQQTACGHAVLRPNQPPPPAGPQILTNCVGFADGSTLYGPVQTARCLYRR